MAGALIPNVKTTLAIIVSSGTLLILPYIRVFYAFPRPTAFIKPFDPFG
jgi:hypothetical protein